MIKEDIDLGLGEDKVISNKNKDLLSSLEEQTPQIKEPEENNDQRQIQELTIMTIKKIHIYPDGKAYIKDNKSWIKEMKPINTAKKGVTKKKAGKVAKVQEEMVL